MSRPLIMSFRPDAAALCLSGAKTMTRRLWRDNDMRAFSKTNGVLEDGPLFEIVSKPWTDRSILLWRVGSSIAIKPRRTAKAVGRVMCTGLRVEHVRDITEEDARREGVDVVSYFKPDGLGRGGEFEYRSHRAGFEYTWRRLNPRGPSSWDANPLVVVIEFRPLREGEK